MALDHPDWSGMQVVQDEAAHKEAAQGEQEKEVLTKSPFDDYYRSEKLPRPGSFDKHVILPATRDAKFLSVGGESSRLGSEEKQFYDTPTSPQKDEQQDPQLVAARKRSRRRLFVLIGLIILIIALAVAIPCGVLLSPKTQTSTAPVPVPNNTTTMPAPAFNGTRLATVEPSVGSDQMWLFWQNGNGDVRLSKLNAQGKWQASISIPLKVAPALGTPFAAANHLTTNLQTGLLHLTYFTKDGYYADVVNDPSQDSEWSDGGLYQMLRAGPNDPHFHMSWGTQANGTSYLYNGGARSGLVNTFTYNAANRTWLDDVHIFMNTSVYGGIATQQENFLSTMRIVTAEQKVLSFYRDVSNTGTGKWMRDNDHTLDGMRDNSSLAAPHTHGDTTLLYYQAPNNTIGLAKVASTDIDAAWASRSDLNIPAQGGSSLQVAVTASGVSYLFLQETGDDVTIYSGSAADLQKFGTLPL